MEQILKSFSELTKPGQLLLVDNPLIKDDLVVFSTKHKTHKYPIGQNEVKREDITNEEYREILDTETHHNHPIIFENNVYRWKQSKTVRDIVDKVGLNDIIMLLLAMGYDKNSEVYRKLYRDIGISLFGYWEVFYWNANHDDDKICEYSEKIKSITRDNKINQILE